MLCKSNPWNRYESFEKIFVCICLCTIMFLPFGKVLGRHTPTQGGVEITLSNPTKDGRS